MEYEKLKEICKSIYLKELSLYTFWGSLSVVINVGFYLFLKSHVDYRIANFFALIISRTFVFVTNKVFVFRTKSQNILELLKEIVRFIFARGITGIIDFFGLIIMVSIFSLDSVYSKLSLQVIVIIMNYILSKKIVFTQNTGETHGKNHV